jgi:hypothetical protein
MKNVEMKLDGDVLTIRVDLSKEYGLSPTGKSVVVGTTGKNVPIVDHADYRVGVNVYRKP